MNNIEEVFRKDCPVCYGDGAYYVTESDYEPPILCCCNMFTDKEWEQEKRNLQSNFFVDESKNKNN